MAKNIQFNSQHAPLFILNNDLTYLGESAGLKIFIGDNPTATPAAGDAVAATISVNNLNGRTHIWGMNILALQDPSGSDGMTRAIEAEVANCVGGVNHDPFSGAAPYRKNAFEAVGHSGSVYNPTSAYTSWANDTTGNKWWLEGVSLSRVKNYGIHFYKNPAGVVDAVLPFQKAAIFDESDSANVLKVNGSHETIIDLSGLSSLGSFIKLKTTSAQTLPIKNGADFNVALKIDSGGTTSQQSKLSLADRGVDKWQIIKGAGNELNIFNAANGQSGILILPAGDNPISIFVNGALKPVTVGEADSAGSGYRILKVPN